MFCSRWISAAQILSVASSLYVDNTTWFNANKTCHLAKPDLKFSSDKVRVDLPEKPSIPGDTNIWVGHTLAFTTLEYLGCWKIDTLPKPVKVFTTQQNVDACCSACGTEFFSIDNVNGEDNCRCFNSDVGSATDGRKCNKVCDNLLCGNRDGNNFMSMYKRVRTSQERDNSPVCFTIDDKMDKDTRECNNTTDIVGIVCSYRSHSGGKNTYMYAVVHRSKNLNWFYLGKKCPTSGSIDSIQTAITETGVYWTLMVGVIALESANATSSNNTVGFGYVNDGILSFTTDTAKHYPALCTNKRTTTSIVTTTTTTIASTAKTTSLATSKITTTTLSQTTTMGQAATTASIGITIPTITNDNNNSGISTSLDKGTMKAADSTGLHIGISVGLVLLIVAVALTYVYWFRFQKKPTDSGDDNALSDAFQNNVYEDEPSVDATHSDDANNYAMPSFPDNNWNTNENIYDDEMLEVDTGAAATETMPVYHILEPLAHGKKPGTQDIQDNTYDVCERDVNTQKYQTDNVYNIAGNIDINVDVYDHAGNGREAVGKTANPGIDESYDVCGHVKTGAANQNGDDDTYNHI